MNIADIIGIIIVLLLAFWGMKKGFVRSIFSLCSLLLSLILALTLYPIVTNVLEDSPVGEYVRTHVASAIEAKEEAKISEETPKALHLPGSIQKTITDTINQATSSIRETVSSNISSLALRLLGIMIVFILVKIILWIILKVLDAVSKLPVIHTANKLLGCVAGACYGVLAIYLLLALLTFTAAMDMSQKITEVILDSKLIAGMYHQNILLNFLK